MGLHGTLAWESTARARLWRRLLGRILTRARPDHYVDERRGADLERAVREKMDITSFLPRKSNCGL